MSEKENKSTKGLTFYITIGSYGGFHFEKTGVCLGWIAIRVLPIDIENTLELLMNDNKELKKKLSRAQT